MMDDQVPTAAKPLPVTALDEELTHTLRGLWRTRWRGLLLFAVIAALGVVVLAFVAIRQASINQEQSDRLRASCQFYRDIATAPITVPPGAKRPSVLGVKIIADSWVAYRHQGCGPPPPVSPSLHRWAGFYHLRLTAAGSALPRITPGTTSVPPAPTGGGHVVSTVGPPPTPATAPPPTPHPTTAPPPSPGPLPTPTVPPLPTPTLPRVLPSTHIPGGLATRRRWCMDPGTATRVRGCTVKTSKDA